MKANLVSAVVATLALQTILAPAYAGTSVKAQKGTHHAAGAGEQDRFAAAQNMSIARSSNSPQVVARTGAHANEGIPVYAARRASHAAPAQGGGYYRVGRVPLPTPEEYRTSWVKPQEKKVDAKAEQEAPTFTYEAYRTWHKPAGHSK